MEGTRLHIVAILQRAPQATVDELAQALGMASATIRRHLDILQRDRLVAYRAIRRKPGRPEHAFYLTEDGKEALPKRYQQLLQRLLQTLGARNGASPGGPPGQELEALFSQVATQIAQPHSLRFQDKPPAERVVVLRELLEAEQFAPATEEFPGQVRVHLLNCPFRSLAMENPAVCALDQGLISQVLGALAANEERINREGHHCVYTVSLPH